MEGIWHNAQWQLVLLCASICQRAVEKAVCSIHAWLLILVMTYYCMWHFVQWHPVLLSASMTWAKSIFHRASERAMCSIQIWLLILLWTGQGTWHTAQSLPDTPLTRMQGSFMVDKKTDRNNHPTIFFSGGVCLSLAFASLWLHSLWLQHKLRLLNWLLLR